MASALAKFYSKTRDARKIIVVDLAFLGDTVHLLPALWEIKRNYPQAELHAVSAPVGAEVLRLAACVDRAWAVELNPARRSLGEQLRLIRALRRERFDVAFNFAGVDRATILTALTGAKHRVALAGGRKHFWNRWLIPNWVERDQPEAKVFEQRRRLLAACGCELGAVKFDLQVTPELRAWAEGLVPAGALHISINSAKPLKEWPMEHYAALLGNLWQRRPEQLVVASAAAKERERERLRQLRAVVPDERLRLLPENLGIAQLAAVLQRCRLHFGPDSGVVHLATAVGTRTVVVLREQKEFRAWLPDGRGHQAISVPCGCVDLCVQPGGGAERAACLAGITPERVAEVIERGILREE